MSNSFGTLFRVTTWGESHGEAIGCVIDGTPSGIALSVDDIQPWLEKRRPGRSQYTTARSEPDRVQILSGVFQGKTTGTPISLLIQNQDQRSNDYQHLQDSYRPGHADYTYTAKYGIRDHRGGGRASARETTMRVAAGAVARQILGSNLCIRGALIQIGEKKIDRSGWCWEQVDCNPFFCPDAGMLDEISTYLSAIQAANSSVGAVIELQASGVPAGLGEPVYGKLDALLAGAMMSIPAVKAVEIGTGFEVAALRGGACIDEIHSTERGVQFASNNAGGMLGGISTGQDILIRCTLKPTSSIAQPVQTINADQQSVTLLTQGRHDPCVGLRAVPVAEAMLACVLADTLLLHRARHRYAPID